MVKTYSTADRRDEIMRILYRSGYSTAIRLAEELGVSERTIRRDISILSLTKPIYTTSGRKTGGIYIVDGYRIDKNYLSEQEEELLKKVIQIAKESKYGLSESEKNQLDKTIEHHCRPKPPA